MLSSPLSTLQAMMDEKVMFLPSHIQSILIQNAAKLYARVIELCELEGDTESASAASNLLLDKMPMFVQSADLEVQERVSILFLFGGVFSLWCHLQVLQTN